MALSLQSLNNIFKETSRSFKIKLEFWNQADVNVSVSKSRVQSDESCGSSHKLDKSDTVFATISFDISRDDSFLGFLQHEDEFVVHYLNSSFETEGRVNNSNIIINSLGNTNDSDLEFSLADFLKQSIDTSVSTITSNTIDLCK